MSDKDKSENIIDDFFERIKKVEEKLDIIDKRTKIKWDEIDELYDKCLELRLLINENHREILDKFCGLEEFKLENNMLKIKNSIMREGELANAKIQEISPVIDQIKELVHKFNYIVREIK